MPIYHKTPPSSSAVGNHNTAEIDYHNSEAAKVKRTREQAYFNSYDFDAIEVLPYDDGTAEEEDDELEAHKGPGKGKVKSNQRERERRQLKSKQIHKQQNKSAQQLTTHLHQQQNQHQLPQQLQSQLQHPVKSQQQISNFSSSSNRFMVDNPHQPHQSHHQHQPLQPVNGKYNPSIYLQRISNIFASKTNNNNNKTQLQKIQQHNQYTVKGHVGGNGLENIPVVAAASAAVTVKTAVNALSHDNKHLKLSSSETSSTTLSASSNAEEIFNMDNICDDGDVMASGSVRNVMATGTRTTLPAATTTTTAATTVTISDKTNLHIQAKQAASATTTNSNGSTSNNGNNFLLPRAMLKYQSSTLNAQQGAAGLTALTAGTTNSMPLATTNAITTNTVNNIKTTNTISYTQQQQQQQQQPRDVHNFKPFKDGNNNNAMMRSSGSSTGLRLKKTSSTSSVITSLASEDIEEEDKETGKINSNNELKKDTKVLAKASHTKISARASSHQSHYSTDKSASSGYYSSNVCSTYSLEEHIYSEPTLDVKKLRNNAKESEKKSTPAPLSSTLSKASLNTATASAVTTLKTNSKLPAQKPQNNNNNLLPANGKGTAPSMRTLDKTARYHKTENEEETLSSNRNSQEFNENLKILESSIENLDRHLKSFPGNSSQEALANYTQNPFNPYASVNHPEKLRSSSIYHQLPTIQETYDGLKKPNWNEEPSDDSLMDIDLDSFLLDKDAPQSQKTQQVKRKQGVDNPTFLTEEQEENHYKCAKYINSCPEDAYRVESDIIAPARSSISGQSLAVSVDLYPKRYEEQLHFQNTRELLEDVRDKIRLLTQTQEAEPPFSTSTPKAADPDNQIPKELNLMINTLKQELELYLDRMNQHSELEIRQLCTGLVKNQHIVKMKNAFERRRSLTEAPDIYSTYEAVQDGIVLNAQGQPISITQQITSIRCSSDPNFKMKRKSLTEVFPLAECYVESVQTTNVASNKTSQLHRNLSYHKPVLEQLNSSAGNNPTKQSTTTSATNTASGGDSSEPNDKDSILDWHRKKPSIWEMYYGTNRIQQSLLGGKKNGLMVTTATSSSPSTMCYPSSRPESDFTLDLPRAEQLRIKMEKEKKFRQRCRVITTFLSLVFFLLTVMVVSLVLTRGKRMFGSMI